MAWYKKMMLMGGGMLTAGTLWYQGRAYLAPMGIDYAEVDGAAVERAWVGLPDAGAGGHVTEAGLRAAMTNDWATAFRPPWSFVSGTLANRVIDTYNLAKDYGARNRLWWIRGGEITGGPLYTRAGSNVTLNGWAPLMDRADTIAAFDGSSDSNAVVYGTGAVAPLDAGTLGNADANGYLTNFSWQARGWRVPSTNELNSMRGVLTNLERVVCFDAKAEGCTQIRYSESYTAEVWNVAGGVAALAEAAWGSLALQSRSVTTTAVSAAHVSGGGVIFDGLVSAASLNNLTNANAVLYVTWYEYRDVTFAWPAAFCSETGLVTAAGVYTCPKNVGLGMEDVAVLSGGSDDPAAFFWHGGNAGLVTPPELYTESVSTVGDTDFHDLAIGSATLNAVGDAGTAFDLVFSWSMPEFSELNVTHSEEDGAVKEWEIKRGSGFYFVIAPDLAFQYLTD